MILSPPSKDVDQELPVTTTFDAPEGQSVTRRAGTRPDGIDWDRVERLYSFVRERGIERMRDARRAHDLEVVAVERQNVHAVDAMFAQARRRRGVVAAVAITFYRARAMRDAQHPDFLGEWLGVAEARSA